MGIVSVVYLIKFRLHVYKYRRLVQCMYVYVVIANHKFSIVRICKIGFFPYGLDSIIVLYLRLILDFVYSPYSILEDSSNYVSRFVPR